MQIVSLGILAMCSSIIHARTHTHTGTHIQRINTKHIPTSSSLFFPSSSAVCLWGFLRCVLHTPCTAAGTVCSPEGSPMSPHWSPGSSSSSTGSHHLEPFATHLLVLKVNKYATSVLASHSTFSWNPSACHQNSMPDTVSQSSPVPSQSFNQIHLLVIRTVRQSVIQCASQSFDQYLTDGLCYATHERKRGRERKSERARERERERERINE